MVGWPIQFSRTHNEILDPAAQSCLYGCSSIIAQCFHIIICPCDESVVKQKEQMLGETTHVY